MKKKEKPKVKNKDLENSITGKFMDAVKGLGHDTDKLKKEIAKAGKSVSQKITSALKKAQKAEAKITAKKDKPAKSFKNTTDKVSKVVSKISKTSAKAPAISSRSVAKPIVPAIEKNLTAFDEKEAVKEASAPAPVKLTRAPRRKKEEITAAKNTEKEVVKEASPAPAKRTRAPRQPKAVTTNEVAPAQVTDAEANR